MKTIPAYEELFKGVEIPPFYRLRQDTDGKKLEDVRGEVQKTLKESGVLERVRPGASVALTAGSREIKNFALIMKTLCDALKERGARPFIIPAMGSHGGAVAQNQTALIAHFGITEEAMGVPIKSSMRVVELGQTAGGIPVYFDEYAAAADAIVVVGRIKIHTCFRGRIESGLMKMLAVGCGKQKGAEAMHRRGFSKMSENVSEVARVALKKLPVIFGLGILENARHQTRAVYAIPAEEIEEREAHILDISRRVSPRIPFDGLDLLVVERIGKNISGTCMDPNITGRSSPLGSFWPNARALAALDLTKESDGSAYGVGNADVITQRLFDKIIFENTYPNGVTNHDIKPMMIPPVMPDERYAVLFALTTLAAPGGDYRIAWLQDTLSLDEFYVSEALALNEKGDFEIDISKKYQINFGADGAKMELVQK